MSNLKAEKAFIQFFDAFSECLKQPVALQHMRDAVKAREEASALLEEARRHNNEAELKRADALLALGETKRTKSDVEKATQAAKDEQEKLRVAKEKHATDIQAAQKALDAREIAVKGREAAVQKREDAIGTDKAAAERLLESARKMQGKAERARAAFTEDAA